MLFVASVLKDLLTKNTENAGQHSNLRKHYIFESPKYPYKDINILKNLNDNKSFINNLITNNQNKCNKFIINNNGAIKKFKNNNEEEENEEVEGKEDEEIDDKDDCESKGTGTYIDDNAWDEIRTNISSISSNSSSTKSYLYKWQPRFLETSLSTSSLEKIPSNYSIEECPKRRKRKFYKKRYFEVDSISSDDIDSISLSPTHSIKISKDVLEKLISKYNLMNENNFKIEDEYIDDTYDDEGCFTHLEFHIH